MTERLATLLREEAELLEIPSPPADAVLTQGRGLRRRRRTITSAAVLMVSAAMAVGAIGVDRLAENRADQPAGPAPYVHGGAFAVGPSVYFGGDSNAQVQLSERAELLYYTSAGVVVRTGNTPQSTTASSSHFILVTPEGDQRDLPIDLGLGQLATDASTSTAAYLEKEDDTWEVVVLDVKSGAELARIAIPPVTPHGDPDRAPSLSLSGDFVYVSLNDGGVEIDWRTGELRRPDWFMGVMAPDVRGGRFVDMRDNNLGVYDSHTGRQLLTVSGKGYLELSLSPDGRFALLREPSAAGVEVFEVATGRRVTVPLEHPVDAHLGWTPDGHLIELSGDTLNSCDPISGACERSTVDIELVPQAARTTITQQVCPSDSSCFDLESVEPYDSNRIAMGDDLSGD